MNGIYGEEKDVVRHICSSYNDVYIDNNFKPKSDELKGRIIRIKLQETNESVIVDLEEVKTQDGKNRIEKLLEAMV